MAGSIKLNAPSGGSVTLNAVDTANNFTMSVPAAAGVLINATSATGAAQLPVGTTAQRPVSPVAGQIRFNSTTNAAEVYSGTAWTNVSAYVASYLIVGGGGAGQQGVDGVRYSGGGGGGQVLQGSLSLVKGTTYTITIGAGGTQPGGNGSSTTGFGLTALGGNGAPDGTGGAARSGGGAGGNANGGNGTTGITVYAAGGGASRDGVGGNVLAGRGGVSGGQGVAGTANSGAGGGGGDPLFSQIGGAGGSGVFNFSILTSEYSGTTTGSPTVTTSGSYTLLRFTASGSYTA